MTNLLYSKRMLTPTYGSINGEATPLLPGSCITTPRSTKHAEDQHFFEETCS